MKRRKAQDRRTTPVLNEPPRAPVFSIPQVSMPLLPCRGDAPFDPMRLTDAHRRANGRIGSSFSAASWTSTDGNSTVPQSKAYLQCERPCPSVLRYRATATADRPRSSMRARCPRSRETSPPPSSGTCLVGPRRSLVGSAVFLRLEMQYRTGDPCECLVASRPVIDEVADGKQAVPAQVAVERCERVFHGAEAPVRGCPRPQSLVRGYFVRFR